MKIRYVISLIAAFSLLTGCIREDRSDCTCDVLLSFIYMGDGDDDIFPEKIDQVNMYVYSAADNSLAGEYVFDKDALTAEQGAHLHLFPGNYRIVCWGNMFENTQVEKTYSEAKVAEPVWFKSDSYTGTDPLYFSDVEISVPESLQDVTETCEFESSHIDMYVKLKGFKGAMGQSGEEVAVNVSHTGCPAYTDFFNVPAAEKCEVMPEIMDDPEDEDSYIMQYNVLRFTEDEATSLILTNSADGNEIYTVSIPDFIDRYEVEVDGKQEAAVAIQITLGPVGVEVVEWNIEDVFPGFDKE
ncbi:MAG: FimB/Mfa2 family fimbrial subunit [Bacteroidetes bacterium]|uniref:FimB/Mfa2 family fimbrial subunit n=1 Tax=Candidatus Cryptobacteroides intestinavium TaxID=2840766 RepID=A0A9D9HHV9_9BACT|nr:FimB/Mfa2 family fimbrial subunit [Candidatus Cryptobacteroides intestinavium]